jgi:hypothetical protein
MHQLLLTPTKIPRCPLYVFRNKQPLFRNTIKGDREGAYRVLVRIPVGKTPLGRPRRRWEDNIKTDLQEVGWGTWTGLIRLRKWTDGVIL